MKNFIIALFSVLILVSCVSGEVRHCEKVIKRHDTNNAPHIVYYYDIVGKDSTCVAEKWFHDNGVLNLEGPIVNGKREGAFRSYYPSGKLMSTGFFENGNREGHGIVYHENGVISIQGDYKNGKPQGLWEFYNEEGELIEAIEY